jgi:hypothetical protein
MFQEDFSKPLATVPGFIQHPPVILYFVVTILCKWSIHAVLHENCQYLKKKWSRFPIATCYLPLGIEYR